ncbi:hypothetical protein [Thalassococcus sp. S3]|uniref:hypothetical protein n=1 Tax=Thalassococcus sp. S3 TaxID=2017482 RepID=UPI0010243285|nr:hypothetical protein [Thalassococcus sp. S3]QBF31665.1 hypothetical protein CFI11_10610 [Thalassococcus sp. S3]
MVNRVAALAGLLAGLSTSLAGAQEPLSVIDWLSENPPVVGPPVIAPNEPPVSDSAKRPEITVRTLDAARSPIGLVPPSVTGLPQTLWRGSETEVLTRLISNAPVSRSPAMQTLLYTLILSEAAPLPTVRADEAVLLARIDRLIQLGAIDPAQSLIEQAGADRNAEVFRRAFETALLIGSEDKRCETLLDQPHLSPGLDAQIFCTARAGDLTAASVMFDGARALGMMPADTTDALDRFLYPEVFEEAAPLPVPNDPDPLLFRLFEAIGEPLPSAPLPRAFAAADLRDLAGWKAQLEAAERLARTGALSTNRLLGLYTARLPAASGGVWDRVEALQRFETALRTRSPTAVSRTLRQAWRAMKEASLEVPFAALFAEPLSNVRLNDPDLARLQLRIALLSPGYETAANRIASAGPESAFWAGLAQGQPESAPPPTAQAEAIALAFEPDPELPDNLSAETLGETILRLMVLFDRGVGGNMQDLTEAIAGFRALGLEDTARRASLQALLLERGPVQ